MSLEWKTVELKSIADVTMGQSPKSEFYNDNFEGMPFLQGNKTFGDKYPSFELYTTSIKKVAKKSSVLMSVRAPVGDLNMAKEDICIGRGVCGLQMKKGDNEFLYYLLKANISHLINKESGTVFGSINKNDIETFEVTLPESSEDQMKILTILKNIDKKIEVCKNLNRNLQNIIKILYKDYFESFEFDNIPYDWKIVNVGQIIDIYNGYSYKSTELQESDCGMVTIKNFNRDGSFRIDGFKEIVYSNKIKKHQFINENDVLISCTDVTQDADIIGNCIIVLDKQKYNKLIMSMDLVKIESKIPEINNFLLATIFKSYSFKKHILGYVNGTTVLHLDKKGIKKFKIAIPKNLSELKNVSERFENIYTKIQCNQKEINKLVKLRDTLLPKLMSGEIDLSEIDS